MSLWARWRQRRRERALARRAIPQALWALTLARYPFLNQTDAAAAARLREMTSLFLDTKEFTGAHGLVVTDEMAVAIAAQACLPVLQLGLHWYQGFVGIVVHADEVRAQRRTEDETGVVHEWSEVLTGEAVPGGPVMLAWRDVAQSGESAEWGYNVVIHEFAHVLDMADGLADGRPPLPSEAAARQWSAVLHQEYQALCAQLDAGEETWLDPYAATGPEEFFAVASENFFVAGAAMQEAHPALYALLVGFYRQDPAAR